MRRDALRGKVPRQWLVRSGVRIACVRCARVRACVLWPGATVARAPITRLASTPSSSSLNARTHTHAQMGGGPRPVTDSWEHMWWDNLHWKR